MSRKLTHLYAGDWPSRRPNPKGFIGLSLSQNNRTHILQDVTKPHVLIPDNSVEIYQAEDVLEHIEYDQISAVLSEVHRILKPGGLFRLSVPDYRCDILYDRCLKTADGLIYHDPGGGGRWDPVNKRVVGGGHVWFPTIEKVNLLLENSPFQNIKYLHYIDGLGNSIMHQIDHSLGKVLRTPDFDSRVQSPNKVMSIVVDCIKSIK